MNDWIKKIGIWYVIHFLVGAAICSLMTIVVVLQDGVIGWKTCAYPMIGTVCVLVLSIIKEMIDDYTDMKDIRFALYGCIPTFIFTFLGVLFNMLSN